MTFHLLRGGIKITLILSGGICITNQDKHPPPNRNDNDDQGPGDGIYYGGVDYHGLLSLLLHNSVDESSSDPTDDGPIDAPTSETDIPRL